MNSNKIRYFDLLTKNEIQESDLKVGVPFLAMTDNWKVRIWKKDEFNRIEEQFLSLESEKLAKQEILLQKLKSLGMTDVDVTYQENLSIDGAVFNIDNFLAQYTDANGNIQNQFINPHNMKNLVEHHEGKSTVNVSGEINCTSIISFDPNDKGALINLSNFSKNDTLLLNLEDYGFKRNYDLGNAQHRAQLEKDIQMLYQNQTENEPMPNRQHGH